tara:strand:+ start:1074 stop:1241 length:168 start_codon:yes stop_codon:yes gene_type:complete
MSYKLLKNSLTGKVDNVKYYESGNAEVKIIPFDQDNTDYQEYLEWSKTNTPEEAD